MTSSQCPSGMICSMGQCVQDPCIAANQSKSSVGCEYYALNLDNILAGACFAAYVTNNWTAPIHIKVDYQGQTLPVDTFTKLPTGQGSQLTYAPYTSGAGLAPGNVAILFLAQLAGEWAPPLGEPCPTGITPAVERPTRRSTAPASARPSTSPPTGPPSPTRSSPTAAATPPCPPPACSCRSARGT